MSGEVLPQRRSCVETRRAPSLPLVAPPLGFPRYRAPEGTLNGKSGSLEAWKFLFLKGRCPTPRLLFFRKGYKARNGGRRARSAAKPQSARWNPRRFAPTVASLRFQFPRAVLPQFHPSPARRALCSPFSVLWGGLAAPTLRPQAHTKSTESDQDLRRPCPFGILMICTQLLRCVQPVLDPWTWATGNASSKGCSHD